MGEQTTTEVRVESIGLRSATPGKSLHRTWPEHTVIGALSHSELNALLRRLTPFEQLAVHRYRVKLAQLHRAHRGDGCTKLALNRWLNALRALYAEANGTPGFDAYCDLQRERRLQWKEQHYCSEREEAA